MSDGLARVHLRRRSRAAYYYRSRVRFRLYFGTGILITGLAIIFMSLAKAIF